MTDNKACGNYPTFFFFACTNYIHFFSKYIYMFLIFLFSQYTLFKRFPSFIYIYIIHTYIIYTYISVGRNIFPRSESIEDQQAERKRTEQIIIKIAQSNQNQDQILRTKLNSFNSQPYYSSSCSLVKISEKLSYNYLHHKL